MVAWDSGGTGRWLAHPCTPAPRHGHPSRWSGGHGGAMVGVCATSQACARTAWPGWRGPGPRQGDVGGWAGSAPSAPVPLPPSARCLGCVGRLVPLRRRVPGRGAEPHPELHRPPAQERGPDLPRGGPAEPALQPAALQGHARYGAGGRREGDMEVGVTGTAMGIGLCAGARGRVRRGGGTGQHPTLTASSAPPRLRPWDGAGAGRGLRAGPGAPLSPSLRGPECHRELPEPLPGG